MVASNFPMDRVSLSWATLYEAFDQLTASLSDDDRRAVFHDNAVGFYGIPDDLRGRT
jgi:predicted TIM-barrel fold metal-dependent hydrolase